MKRHLLRELWATLIILTQHHEEGSRSDELPWRLRAQMVEPEVAAPGNHLDAGSPSLGGGNSGCGCCYGHRPNLSWVNVVPSKSVSSDTYIDYFTQ